MLYPVIKHRKPRATASPPAEAMHYFDWAERLQWLQTQGHTRADMARLTGMNTQQVHQRLQLLALEEGLRAELRQSGAPEKIAWLLLALPDPITRRRTANRIVRERLCIRDAGLLVHAALQHHPAPPPPDPSQRQVITAIRDVRLYRNAIRDIAEQMKTAGVSATFTERKTGSIQELTVAYSTRRRRTERFQSI